MGSPLDAGRRIAGLLGYNPGPGLYSRMTRAVEGMPKVIRTQELPGLLRKYPEGVPGWEVNAVAPALEGVQSIPRQDLLELIQQHSPAFTHREVILGGNQPGVVVHAELGSKLPTYQSEASRLGAGISHGEPHYESYSQGGKDYAELLLLQPGQSGLGFGSHWSGRGLPLQDQAVAHARYDIHGDAMRINELQSDLGIHNRKIREKLGEPGRATARYPDGTVYALDEFGIERPVDPQIPFPLEDAWADILIKRLALEAARGGHRAIEIASPRAIADKVGGNIENYQHFYGKVVPGAIERLGRKMGGMAEHAVPPGAGGSHWADTAEKLNEEIHQYITAAPRQRTWFGSNESANKYRRLVDAVEAGPVLSGESTVAGQADALYRSLMRNEGLMADEAAEEMTKIMSLAERHAKAQAAFRIAHHKGVQYGAARTDPPGRRYLMSDEMRKRILEGGIGLSVLGGLAAQEE